MPDALATGILTGVPALDATERIDMRHSTKAEWRFRYEVVSQASPLVATVPLNLSARSYECAWLDDVGSDTVLATATINMAEASTGAITAIVDEAVVGTLGERDVWYYLLETNGGDPTVVAAGYVTLVDIT